jgi:hypothetical protein
MGSGSCSGHGGAVYRGADAINQKAARNYSRPPTSMVAPGRSKHRRHIARRHEAKSATFMTIERAGATWSALISKRRRPHQPE